MEKITKQRNAKPSVAAKSKSKAKDAHQITLEEARDMPTLDIADAGRIFLGLNRNASYDAARAGVIPTIEVGGHRMKAVTKALAEKVGVTVNF